MFCSVVRRVHYLWGVRGCGCDFSELRCLHEFLNYFGREVRRIVRLHPCWGAVPGKPLVKDDLCRGLRVVFVEGAWESFCEIGEMIYYDQ